MYSNFIVDYSWLTVWNLEYVSTHMEKENHEYEYDDAISNYSITDQ